MGHPQVSGVVRREGQLWPCVEMTGRCEGSGSGDLESHLIPTPPCSVGTAQSFGKDGARKVQQSSQGPVVGERT